MQDTKFIAIIPARYASTRFPGKPLALLGGKPVLQRVVEQVRKAGIEAVVATDDTRISDAMEALGIRCIMTSTEHKSGTDRIEEAARKLNTDADVIINVQGDEPFILPEQIHALMQCFDNADTRIATLAKEFDPELGFDAIFSPNLVKVTFSDKGKALYFSRSIIPYIRNAHHTEWLNSSKFFTHIGMYAYRRQTLSEITKLPQSTLEKAESLEQLRWLQNGYDIQVAVTKTDTVGIDTPEDLAEAEKFLLKHKETFV